MIFNHTNEQFEELSAIYTATEIHQQPATWVKTIAQVKACKEELKAFISQVTSQDDYDIVLYNDGDN